MVRKPGQERAFEIRWKTELPYRYSIGKLAVKFFEELKESGKLFGSKCSKCGRVHFPPRAVCVECFIEMTVNDMVEVSSKGTLVGFTVVNYPFVDPNTGATRPFPYGYGLFQLDGADTYTMHFVDETDYTKMKVGQRVEAVFREKREGNSGDIIHFKIIEGDV